MNLLIRWAKFNLVGVMGMAVQLATLAILNRCFHGHYLLASAAAVELTLLHNFTWHMHYTWRDRTADTVGPTQHQDDLLPKNLLSLPEGICVWICCNSVRLARGLGRPTFNRLLRFHLSNGLVSMAGNLALMRLLVSEAHLPLLAANIVAILCCSVINFLLSDAWAFAIDDPPTPACSTSRF